MARHRREGRPPPDSRRQGSSGQAPVIDGCAQAATRRYSTTVSWPRLTSFVPTIARLPPHNRQPPADPSSLA
eukprot:CAMPEP_0176261458 /NCGR_PEP_ID=MMETSP0121_2-20121125/40108_1 /TAXON_ID=160619 /ORGANISM="Kryptoperidinium foliaceum, Strain CCMP 1326" /LENGTH=71 /DNA_ID=CAMNT_0017601399 /DNA_START=484 /DNA_END=696 /DNA_ORIENTATION=-